MYQILFVALAVSLLLNAALILRFVWVRKSRTRWLATRLVLLASATLFVVLMVEIGFVFFVAQSDGFGFTRSAYRWRQKYEGKLNSAGLRDREHDKTELQEKRRIYVVGDSFAAGHGVKNRSDRFADQLQAQLGDASRVVLLAKGGWSTKEELATLKRFEPPPDVVIFSYFYNDIENAAVESGLERPSTWPTPSRWLRPLVDHSDFFNFVYWRWFRYSHSQSLQKGYSDFLSKAYGDRQIWETHKQQLLAVDKFCQDQNAELIVLLFPNLVNPEASQKPLAKVAEVFRERGRAVLEVAEWIKGKPVNELIVNAMDAHPSPALHHKIAEELKRELDRED